MFLSFFLFFFWWWEESPGLAAWQKPGIWRLPHHTHLDVFVDTGKNDCLCNNAWGSQHFYSFPSVCEKLLSLILFWLNFRSDAWNRNSKTFEEDITRQIVGCTVLTRYNNKTYRIDDIDWGKTPQNSFESSSGQQITFVDYYWYVLVFFNCTVLKTLMLVIFVLGLFSKAVYQKRVLTSNNFCHKMGWGCSSVGRAPDWHAANAGSIPWCCKGVFSQSQLSVQTLLVLRCPDTSVCSRMHLHLCAH